MCIRAGWARYPGAFWRVIEHHRVKTLFTAPTAFRAIKKEDPNGERLERHDLSRFEYLFLAGERLDPDTHHWATNLLHVPVIDHWWQTEPQPSTTPAILDEIGEALQDHHLPA